MAGGIELLPGRGDCELGGLEQGKADDDAEDAEVDVVLRHRLAIYFHEIRLARGVALERALSEEALHERADAEPDLRPERLAVGFEDHPSRAPE